MSRIIIDARESGTSTGRYLDKLVEHLHGLPRASQHEFSIIVHQPRFDFMTALAPNFTVEVTSHRKFTWGEQLGFARQLHDLKADLVHFGMTQQPVLYRGKVVTTIHDLTTLRFKNLDKNQAVFAAKQQVYKWLTRRVARKSQAIITSSVFVKNDLVGYARVPAEKITVVYQAADLIADRPTPLLDLKDKQFILYVGRPTPHKNLERLVQAFKLLQASHPSLILVLAGKKDVNYQRLSSNVLAKGIKNVRFTGFVNDGELRWLYENCAAYVFPSLSEGFGLPGLEAMAHGAPVASSNATCLPEVYGDAAHYFDPRDVTAMADAINEILTDKRLRQALIKRGHEQVKRYSWRQTAEQTLAVYDKILGG